MKLFIFIIFIACLTLSCNNEVSKSNESTTESEKIPLNKDGIPIGAAKADSYYEDEAEYFEQETEKLKALDIEAFLKLFDESGFEDLHVYSSKNEDYGDFNGTKISAEFSYLFRDTELAENFNSDDNDFDVFACKKIVLTDTIIGVIIRHYGLFTSNQVSIFFINKVKKSVVSDYKLAINFGDEGNSENMESWIRNLKYELLIYSWTINRNTATQEIIKESQKLISTTGIYYDSNSILPWINPELDPVMKNNLK